MSYLSSIGIGIGAGVASQLALNQDNTNATNIAISGVLGGVAGAITGVNARATYNQFKGEGKFLKSVLNHKNQYVAALPGAIVPGAEGALAGGMIGATSDDTSDIWKGAAIGGGIWASAGYGIALRNLKVGVATTAKNSLSSAMQQAAQHN